MFQPSYHFHARPDEGVCCPYDPNGAIWWRGRYHLMYIYQDPARPNGGHCWGHASSADLVHWTYHAPAVVPEPGDPDVGIFSGNAFLNRDGVPMLCWFGVDAGVCVATAEDDDLLRWRRHPANPIIPCPQPGDPGHGVYTVWDPYLWLEGDTYYCLLGGNELYGKDTLYLCRSQDLVHWEPRHAFYEHADLGWTGEGEDCSCPDFFALGDRHALLCISHKVGARIYLGRFDREAERFLPDQHVRLNWPGGMYFAPESLLAPDGRRIAWAWVTDPRVRPAQQLTGSGVMSLPRVLSLDAEGQLRQAPVAELSALRRNPVELAPQPKGAPVPLELPGSPAMELELEFEPRAHGVVVEVRRSPDGDEATGIWYNRHRGVLGLDMGQSTRRDDVVYGQPPFAAYQVDTADAVIERFDSLHAPLHLAPDEPLRLRIFIDGPVIEVFANDRQALVQQVYPSREDSLGIAIWAGGDGTGLTSGRVWSLAPARFEAPVARYS